MMVPGLEERLMEGSDDGVVLIAEMVGTFFRYFLLLSTLGRFRKVPPALGLMT